MEGWIKLDRGILDHWLWNDTPFSYGQAWIDLLLLANHDDVRMRHKGEIIVCKRGTVNRSILNLSERWKWSRKKTTHFLKLLESDGMVTTEVTTHRTTITLVNYGFYQGEGTTKRTTKVATRVTTDAQQTHTNKNERMKEEININIFISLPLNDGTDYLVSDTQLNELKELYPSADVEQELRNMRGWLNGNPTKRKTKSGINRFINSWLAREQNKGGQKSTAKRNSFNDIERQNYGTDLERMLGVM